MLVKCQICGLKINRDIAYKIQCNNRNKYYCSYKEYTEHQQELTDKDALFDLINALFGYRVINSALFKEITIIHECYKYSQIISYIKTNRDKLSAVLNREYSNEYCKIKYFVTIISNNIKDYITNCVTTPDKVMPIEITTSKYKHKKRKSLSDYEGSDID